MKIHVEGVGLLGSMLLNRLALDADVTWSDTQTAYTAWSASTGLVYPDNDMAAFEYNVTCWSMFKGYRRVPYVYAHKAPPHGFSQPALADYGLLRRGPVDAAVIDVGRFVEGTRERFSSLRAVEPPAGATVIQARPSQENTVKYFWGWSAPVSFDLPTCLPSELPQPALYAKAHRFDLTYAYPYLPGVWLAGSSSIIQAKPARRDDAEERFQQWWENAERLLGLRNIKRQGDIEQGWRPKGAPGGPKEARVVDGRWVMPSLGGSGVRKGWTEVDRLVNLLMSDML